MIDESATSTAATPDECQQLVARIVASRHMLRSARLRDFLLYVVERSLNGATNIPEQEVGEAVFNRTPDYDTSLDNIVRVNATELRKRLDQYFAKEGASEPITLSIPRGSYVVTFSRRYDPTRIFDTAPDDPPATTPESIAEPASGLEFSASAPVSSEQTSQNQPFHTQHTYHRYLVGAVALLIFFVGFLSLALYRQSVRYSAMVEPWRSTPELERFWSPFFVGQTQLDLVTADTSLALVKDFSGQPITLDNYIHYRYEDPSVAATWSADRRADLEQVLDRNMVSLGDVHVAQKILRLSPYGPTIRLISAREFNTESMRQNNVVLIGSRESNPWVDLFKDQLNFSLEYDLNTHRAFIINRAPLANEQPRYESTSQREGYAVIALLPGLSPDRHVLIIGGTDAQATQAAGEFMTSPATARALMSRLPGSKVVPFEVLLRTTQLTGTPLRSDIIAIRASK